jgi:hypothetical protein
VLGQRARTVDCHRPCSTERSSTGRKDISAFKSQYNQGASQPYRLLLFIAVGESLFGPFTYGSGNVKCAVAGFVPSGNSASLGYF